MANTDAEGRFLLSDGLSWLAREKVRHFTPKTEYLPRQARDKQIGKVGEKTLRFCRVSSGLLMPLPSLATPSALARPTPVREPHISPAFPKFPSRRPEPVLAKHRF